MLHACEKVHMNKAFNVFIFPFMWFLTQKKKINKNCFIFYSFCENNVVIGNLWFLYRW